MARRGIRDQGLDGDDGKVKGEEDSMSATSEKQGSANDLEAAEAAARISACYIVPAFLGIWRFKRDRDRRQ